MIDVHTHLIPEVPEAAVAAAGMTWEDGALAVAGHRVGPPALYQVERLLDWLGATGLTGAVVSIPPPLYRQGLDEASARVWVRAMNEAMARLVEPHPALIGAAYLPLEHAELALAEVEAGVRAGVRVFTGSAGGGSLALDDLALRPVWEQLEQADRAIVLHPGSSADARLEEHYLHNLLGNPVETGVAAGQLLFGGVLERYPRLRVALVHCGGVLPAVLGRWQRGVDTHRPGVAREGADLRAEARQLWADGLAHDERVLDLAVDVFGPDHMLLGSDWPFPMDLDDPASAYAHRVDQLGIVAGTTNAEAFLGGQAAPPVAPR